MADALRLEVLDGGAAIRPRFEPLAEVRIRVFRDYPYLYQGHRDYEAHYLETYFASARSFVTLVWDGEQCVGATTAIPLVDADADARRPFEAAAAPIERIDYFGESVLLPPYRGRGLGVKFFELREAHARRHGLDICAFCAVERPDEHPARPADYVANDRFWTHRGYARDGRIQTSFAWPDIGESVSTDKPMTFWLRELSGG